NYINPFGFTNGVVSPLNVNYDFLAGTAGTPLSSAQQQQNIANLQYSPRAPVFVITNRLLGSNDFRFYIDLNRNGRFEPTGLIRENNAANQTTTNIVASTGDPQWVGELEFPDRAHSVDNKFI